MNRQTYALLIYRTSEDESLPERDVELALAHHRKLQTETKEREQLHAVARLHDSRASKVVVKQLDTHEITDGPYIETKEWLVGFYVIDCASEEEALQRAAQICPVAGHAIEVRLVAWHDEA